MKFISTVIIFLLSFSSSFSQSAKPYRTSSSELIFSYGLVNDTAGKQMDALPRFSGFFHHQELINFDFGKHVGIYTGFGVRNIGLITRPSAFDTLGVTKKVKLKQRAYGIGIPLTIKFGNMDDGRFLALGGEAEYFFNYKEKFFVDGKKHKFSEWFSDRVTPFNPSVFIEWQDANGVFIRAKYYLFDFLKPQDNIVINDSLLIPGYSKSSILFSLSIGLNIRARDKEGLKDKVMNKPTAFGQLKN